MPSSRSQVAPLVQQPALQSLVQAYMCRGVIEVCTAEVARKFPSSISARSALISTRRATMLTSLAGADACTYMAALLHVDSLYQDGEEKPDGAT